MRENDNSEIVKSILKNNEIKIDFKKRFGFKINDLNINYEDALNIISSLDYFEFKNIFNDKINNQVDNMLIMAYIAFHNDDLYIKAFETNDQRNIVNSRIAIFWENNLINATKNYLINLKYINTILNTSFVDIISKSISDSNRNKFNRSVSEFRLEMSLLADSGGFIKAYVGDMSSSLNDDCLLSFNLSNVAKMRDDASLLKFVFLASNFKTRNKPVEFENIDDLNSLFIDFSQSISNIINSGGKNNLIVRLTKSDNDIIDSFISGKISNELIFMDLINVVVKKNPLTGGVSQPTIASKCINGIKKSNSKNKKNKKSENVTFDDLVIESSLNDGSKIKNYFIDFLLIIFIILSFAGYLFKYTTLNEIIEYENNSEYSYENSEGSQKTKIIIERVGQESTVGDYEAK